MRANNDGSSGNFRVSTVAIDQAAVVGEAAGDPCESRATSADLGGRVLLSRYQASHEQALLDCLHRGFACRVSAERWRSLHLENPAGPSIVFVARNGEPSAEPSRWVISSMGRRIRIFDVWGYGGSLR
jgi:hypothetical protein